MDLRQRIRKYITNPLKKLIYPLFGYKLISYRKHTDRCVFAHKRHNCNKDEVSLVLYQKIDESERSSVYNRVKKGELLHKIRYGKDRIIKEIHYGKF